MPVLFSSAYGQHHHAQLHSTCHCHRNDRSEEDAVQILMTEMDHDKDGEVTTAEVVIGLADVLQKNLSVPDEIILGMNEASLIALAKLDNSIHVTEDEFVRLWHEKFGDCVDFVAAVFRSFDDNRDGIINVQELEGILFHVRQVAGNLDGHITTQEFHDFFTWVSTDGIQGRHSSPS
ncbi:hypothetical protein BaRGS_00026323 [Batillaria attramentaria]|uniref:EF-hand domain-containing protein n=1 Tax=Batillaria attramentaria TaxID=370345 RepID=A0ABD0K6E6_9CAEN